jgi:hypothetical protein
MENNTGLSFPGFPVLIPELVHATSFVVIDEIILSFRL